MIKSSALDELLGQVFDSARSDLRVELRKSNRAADYEKLRQDFVFHMTDCLDDLKRLHALEQAPEDWKVPTATTFLIGFLYHVVPHLDTAGRLLLDDIADPFVHDEAARILEGLAETGPANR